MPVLGPCSELLFIETVKISFVVPVAVTDAGTTALLKKSQTAFYGSAMKSGIWKATNTTTSGRWQRADRPDGSNSANSPKQ